MFSLIEVSFLQIIEMWQIIKCWWNGSTERVIKQVPTRKNSNSISVCCILIQIFISHSFIHTNNTKQTNCQGLKEWFQWKSSKTNPYKENHHKKLSLMLNTVKGVFSFSLQFLPYKFWRLIKFPNVEGMAPLKEFPDRRLQSNMKQRNLSQHQFFFLSLFLHSFIQVI